MRSAVFIFACFAFMIGCAPGRNVFTVAQAHDALRLGEERRVTVVGYYISHFEGDSVEMQPGDPRYGIPLVFGPGFLGEKPGGSVIVHSLGGRYDQKYVMVHGMLKRGEVPGWDRIPDVVFLEVERVAVPENPPIPTKSYKQFEESSRKNG